MGPAKTLTCVLVGSTLGMMAIRAEAVERKAVPSATAARPCPARGPGFIQLPGAETCLRIGGRLRGEAGTRRTSAGDSIGLHSEGRLDLDARTQTDYGPVRTFVRIRGGATRADGWDR
jgi:hypothetical protein